jgi:alpha-tubulin suppressor-like RCC1 family protein
MRSTRRLLDRHSFVNRHSSARLGIVIGLVAAAAAASCSSTGDGAGREPDDAGAEADVTTNDDAAVDAGDVDAPPPRRDAAPFDGGPLPITCAAPPCAVSLVTTLGPYDYDYSEGFCALLGDGTVACWGANNAGQLGRGDDAAASGSAIAARVDGLSNVAQLDHTCALDKSGGVWCWGTGPFLRNDAGTATTEPLPIKLDLPPAKSVGIGIDVGCAVVQVDGEDSVLCWGKNTSGQIAPFESDAPTAVLTPRAIAIPPGAPIRKVVVSKTAFLLREDGVAMSWGANILLARTSSLVPDPHPMPIPLAGIASLDLTSDSACATVSGIGYCWGRAVYSYVVFDRRLPEPVVTPEPVVQIATTRAVSTAELGDVINQPQRWCAVGASGAVYCWGYNGGGQAGDGTKKDALDAVKVQGLPERAVEVRATPNATCALLTNGKVYCWGTNYYGQLGNGKMRVPSLVPQEVVLP